MSGFNRKGAAFFTIGMTTGLIGFVALNAGTASLDNKYFLYLIALVSLLVSARFFSMGYNTFDHEDADNNIDIQDHAISPPFHGI